MEGGRLRQRASTFKYLHIPLTARDLILAISTDGIMWAGEAGLLLFPFPSFSLAHATSVLKRHLQRWVQGSCSRPSTCHVPANKARETGPASWPLSHQLGATLLLISRQSTGSSVIRERHPVLDWPVIRIRWRCQRFDLESPMLGVNIMGCQAEMLLINTS